jgi:hypothetical protein
LRFVNLGSKSLLFSYLCSKSLLNRSNLCSVDFFLYTFFLLKFKFFAQGFNPCFFSIFAQNLCSTVPPRIQNRHGACTRETRSTSMMKNSKALSSGGGVTFRHIS